MITNRELVSRVAVGLRSVAKDASIRWRYILSIARVKSKFLMSQKLDELSLNKEEGIKTTIECFPLKRVKTKDCGIIEFNICSSIMKSCSKLPDTLFGKSGTGVVRVSSIDVDNTFEYKYVTTKEYARLHKRKYRNTKARYFTVKDGYLFLPDSSAELIDLEIIAIDKDEAESVSSCSKGDVACKNAWDTEFVCPDRFLDLVIQDTISEIANFYRTSQPDTNPNMDENQKGATTL